MILLQSGQIPTVNLAEWLAVNHFSLLRHIVEELELQARYERMRANLEKAAENKIMKIIPAIAKEWLTLLNELPPKDAEHVFAGLASHPSDSVRCWAAYIVGLDERLSLEQKLQRIRPFAADGHFGVREIAWMAVRESVSGEIDAAIRMLHSWAQDEDANIRRFAIESIRPQGVWAKHIPQLKEAPEKALSLLELVKSDPAKYVQDSVSNWLNDASKMRPEWVRQVCEAWQLTSNTKETKRIVTRAQRSLNRA